MSLRDGWLDFWHALPPFRGRLAIARIVAQHLLTTRRNQVAWAKLGNGFRMKVDLRWRGGYDVLYYFRVYEPPLTALIRAAIDRPGATLLDVGANIGAFCFLAADVLRRNEGNAVAIEPLPQNLQFLEESLDANALRDCILALATAVGDRDGVLTIEQRRSGEIANGIPLGWSRTEQDASGFQVAMTTIDALAQSVPFRNVEFVKMDIEGAEMYALRGARELLRAERPLVYAEFHRQCMAANGTTAADVADFAASLDFEVHYLSDRGVVATPPPTDSRFLDVVLVPRDPSEHQRRVLLSQWKR